MTVARGKAFCTIRVVQDGVGKFGTLRFLDVFTVQIWTLRHTRCYSLPVYTIFSNPARNFLKKFMVLIILL